VERKRGRVGGALGEREREQNERGEGKGERAKRESKERACALCFGCRVTVSLLSLLSLSPSLPLTTGADTGCIITGCCTYTGSTINCGGSMYCGVLDGVCNVCVCVCGVTEREVA